MNTNSTSTAHITNTLFSKNKNSKSFANIYADNNGEDNSPSKFYKAPSKPGTKNLLQFGDETNDDMNGGKTSYQVIGFGNADLKEDGGAITEMPSESQVLGHNQQSGDFSNKINDDPYNA